MSNVRTYNQSINLATDLFNEVILPELSRFGKFYCIENTNIDVLNLLDRTAGIDYILNDGKGLYGIANRIQIGDKNWHTFTIRKERESGALTEFAKRKLAFDVGYLYPKYTIQSYVNKDNNLLDFAIAKTEDIFKAIEMGLCKETYTKKDQIGQASFYVVDWYKMLDNGFNIFIWENEKEIECTAIQSTSCAITLAQ